VKEQKQKYMNMNTHTELLASRNKANAAMRRIKSHPKRRGRMTPNICLASIRGKSRRHCHLRDILFLAPYNAVSQQLCFILLTKRTTFLRITKNIPLKMRLVAKCADSFKFK
jgi:hypothetical protein